MSLPLSMQMFTLPNGVQRPVRDVSLGVASQRFFYGSFDVTDYLEGAQKRSFPGYDVERANREASDQARIDQGLQPYADGAEFSWWNVAADTASGIGDDVASAAQSIRDFAGIGPENAGRRSPLFWVVVIGGLGFIAYQVGLFAWLKKKLTA